LVFLLSFLDDVLPAFMEHLFDSTLS
jgi:hypothetical protein